MADFKDIMMSESDENERKCELCAQQGNDSTALKICKECDEMLCTECAAAHVSQKYARSHCLQEITEKSKLRDEKGPEKKCEPCATQGETVDAWKFCQECEELLCDKCSTTHASQKLTKQHQQISIDDMKLPDARPCEPCLENGTTVAAIKCCKICEEDLCKKCVNAHRSQKATKSHDLVEICDYTQDKKPTSICEPCKENGKDLPASAVCAECEEFLCPSCANIHKTQKATRGHNLMNVADIPITVCEPCSEKGNNVLADKVCKECEEALCLSCISHHKSQKATKNHSLEEIQLNLADLKFCDPCGEAKRKVSATKYCEECEEFFCANCSKMHGVQKATRRHELVDPKFARVKSDDNEKNG